GLAPACAEHGRGVVGRTQRGAFGFPQWPRRAVDARARPALDQHSPEIAASGAVASTPRRTRLTGSRHRAGGFAFGFPPRNSSMLPRTSAGHSRYVKCPQPSSVTRWEEGSAREISSAIETGKKS